MDGMDTVDAAAVGQRPNPYQPRPERGTSVGLGLKRKTARGLKARSNFISERSLRMVPGFQPFVRVETHSLGVAQGWYEFRPLAFKRDI